MFVGFTESLYKKLIENEFSSMLNDELDEHTHNIALNKQIGPVLYIVNIINTDHFEENTYEGYSDKIKDNLNRNKLDFQHVILLNIFVTADMSEELFAYINKQTFDAESAVNSVNWAVDLNQVKLFVSSNCDKILNIHKIITSILAKKIEIKNDKIKLSQLETRIRRETALAPKSSNTYLTFALMGINILIFIIMNVYGRNMDTTELILKFGANSPEHIFNQKQYYRLFTSLFIHIGGAHIMYNCFSLYLFGNRVEKYFGKTKFLIVYFFAGLAGSGMSVLFTQAVSAGASGAIYGLIGAVAALSYKKDKQVDGLSFYIMIIIIVLGLAFGFLDSTIDNFAHIGGLIAGYFVGVILCPKETKKDVENLL